MDQSREGIKSIIVGININISFTLDFGLVCSLVNNFRASANGWVIPINIGLFGPFRS